MNKCFLLLMVLVFTCFLAYTQTIKEQYREEYATAPLNVGDKMPNIPLGTVINNYTGKTLFSQFRGKLIILDFWSTYCTTCMELFPHMEKLQKEFGDSIQIFLVNPKETQEQIKQRLRESFFGKYSKLKFPDLPSIVNASQLDSLFPTPRGLPHHVWIDKDGIIRVSGPPQNTYKENIRNLLLGKNIVSIKNENSAPDFIDNKSYFKVLGSQSLPSPVDYGSFFTPYNSGYAPLRGGKVEDLKNAGSGSVRNTFINIDILRLYQYVFKELIQRNVDKTLYSNGIHWEDNYCKLLVKDTFQYVFDFIPLDPEDERYTAKNFIKSKFCYEQLLPMPVAKEERRNYMLEDLNRYFGILYNVHGSLEKTKITCYVIQRTSGEDKLIARSETFKWAEPFVKDGAKKVQYNGVGLKQAIIHSLSYGLFDRNQQGKSKVFLLDETGINGKINIILPDPNEIGSIDDLRKALHPYDLDILKTERILEMLVLREKDYHN